MLKEQGDMDLIRKIINKKDFESQKLLYEKYKKMINDYIVYKYPSDVQNIDDDISEIMTKIFMKLDSYDETKSKFKSWVITITNNYMIDKWRKNKTNDIHSFTSTFTQEINNKFNPQENNYESVDSLDYVSTLLDPNDYKLLKMKYFEGYNYSEIGVEFNVSSSTVSNRINYVKTKLKKNNLEIVLD